MNAWIFRWKLWNSTWLVLWWSGTRQLASIARNWGHPNQPWAQDFSHSLQWFPSRTCIVFVWYFVKNVRCPDGFNTAIWGTLRLQGASLCIYLLTCSSCYQPPGQIAELLMWRRTSCERACWMVLMQRLLNRNSVVGWYREVSPIQLKRVHQKIFLRTISWSFSYPRRWSAQGIAELFRIGIQTSYRGLDQISAGFDFAGKVPKIRDVLCWHAPTNSCMRSVQTCALWVGNWWWVRWSLPRTTTKWTACHERPTILALNNGCDAQQIGSGVRPRGAKSLPCHGWLVVLADPALFS